MSVKSAGNLSTLFDVGGIVGGVLAGYISDRLRARAITAASFMYLAIPSLFAYRRYGGSSKAANVALMMVSGLFVNGPYALITTAVSADLGTHSSLRGDSRALATVAAIIDGTGSAGAAIGPLLTGVLSRTGWGSVFLMLMVGAFVAGALLSFLVKAEILEILRTRHREPPPPPPAGDPEGEGKRKFTKKGKKNFFLVFWILFDGGVFVGWLLLQGPRHPSRFSASRAVNGFISNPLSRRRIEALATSIRFPQQKKRNFFFLLPIQDKETPQVV